ncbi:MAG: hypothetical protein NUV90_01050 [Candidatus Parcubacteria bacterium]|nr:hypothetical protein [Candidatus Parcubacteria bacterium]
MDLLSSVPIWKLGLYFVIAICQDFVLTLNWRAIAKEKIFLAVSTSFVISLLSFWVLYNILADLNANRSIISVFVYSAGIATGTFLAMKFKLKDSK